VQAEPTAVVRALQVLSKAAGSDGLVGGEVADVAAEGKQVDAETLQFIHTHKTGALISASCEIGALLAGGHSEEVTALAAYGESVGLAFQIADDLLNEGSSEEVLGKAVGSDRLRNKATYPGLYGMNTAREAAESTIREACALVAAFKHNELLISLARHAIERYA
jgi:geranylgeranyl diphosphate synthase type II